VSEPELDAHAVGTLQNVLLRAPQPWVLDWTPLESMDLKAARALLGIFTLWGDQESELRFLGASAFRELLKRQTPSGRRDVEQLWWELRMAVLRVMNRPDEFELTALDFCVTYEVSSWHRELRLRDFQEDAHHREHKHRVPDGILQPLQPRAVWAAEQSSDDFGELNIRFCDLPGEPAPADSVRSAAQLLTNRGDPGAAALQGPSAFYNPSWGCKLDPFLRIVKQALRGIMTTALPSRAVGAL
jgi:hypothetical protein